MNSLILQYVDEINFSHLKQLHHVPSMRMRKAYTDRLAKTHMHRKAIVIVNSKCRDDSSKMDLLNSLPRPARGSDHLQREIADQIASENQPLDGELEEFNLKLICHA